VRHAAPRLVAFAALLGLLAPVALNDAVQTIQSSRRRATRTEVDEHPELFAFAEPTRSLTHELHELGPFVEVAPVRLTPPPEIAIECELPRAHPFVRFDRARPRSRAPPVVS
jgi:hypothetical protein